MSQRLFFVGMAAPSILISTLNNIGQGVEKAKAIRKVSQAGAVLSQTAAALEIRSPASQALENLQIVYTEDSLLPDLEKNLVNENNILLLPLAIGTSEGQVDNKDPFETIARILDTMSRAVGLIEFNSTLGLVVFFVAIFLIYRMWMQAKLLETTKIFREQLARTDPDFKALQEKIREVGLTPEQAATLLDKGNAIEKGLAVFGEQKFDEAIERFTEGIRETSDAFFYRAIAYFEKGEYFNSLEDWDQLRKLNPTDADALNGSAWILIEKSHDIDKGIKNAEKALALVPNNPNYEDTLAWGFYKKGKYQESLDLLRKAVKKSPNDEEIKRHLTKVESELTATIP